MAVFGTQCWKGASTDHVTSAKDAARDRLRLAFLRSLAAVLCAAAVAKAIFPVGPSLLETSWLASPLVHSAIIVLEILSAAWFYLVAEHYPRVTRWGGTSLFGGFALVSLHSLVNGTSCNCFGSLAIPPSVTLAFDLLAVVGLNYFISSTSTSWPLAMRYVPHAGILAGALAVGLGAYSYTNAPSELSDLGLVSGDSSLVVLRPTEWIGKPLPLLRIADLPAEVGQGEWLVVLHSRTCDHCREIVPLMIERIAASPSNTASPRLALVDLAPGTPLYQDQPHVISRVLPDTHQWFVPPPIAVRIRDGVVDEVFVEPDHFVALLD